ncbi:MAG: hypothetical protein JO241_05175 [Candidatus Eremiobacteraeota bacterium]|nr:hypothetical protein [Candidatus Eremiobacteraeota bacterium]MBV8583370.1 hypothetical protein [Candidatus Eremiobacteraeota bacterium]
MRHPEWLAVAIAVALAGCSFQNKYESEADKITQAVIHNDLSPVRDDIDPNVHITRVQVAQWSDELSAQGKLQSVKEITQDCTPGWHCFLVKFDKHNYLESLRYNEQGKIVDWRFHMTTQPA